MRLHLLGSGSAAGWPAPFCECPNCLEARRRGGVNLRGRAGALVDDDLKIDFGPDTLLQLQQTGRNLARVKTILFTHHHNDHVYPADVRRLLPPHTQTPPGQVHVYANAATIDKLEHLVTQPKVAEALKLHTIQAGDFFETTQGDRILAMPAAHEQGAVLYRITRDGKTLFYGHDSGPYPQETLDALGDGTRLDIALFDCNHGGLDAPNQRHMSVENVLQMVGKLRESGAITDRTRCIATHFSHKGGLLHEELVRTFLPHEIEVAYDGMLIEV